jgi:hypothetical protein
VLVEVDGLNLVHRWIAGLRFVVVSLHAAGDEVSVLENFVGVV